MSSANSAVSSQTNSAAADSAVTSHSYFTKDERAINKLKDEVEKAKRLLSSVREAQIEIKPFFGNEDFSEKLTRDKFEELNSDLFKIMMDSVEKVLKDADMQKREVDDILLAGGSTRTPKIRQLITEYFDKESWIGINNEEVVTHGAAIHAGILSGEGEEEICGIDISYLTLGIETAGAFSGVMTKVIPRNTVIPTKKSHIFTTVKDNQEKIIIKVYEWERPMTKDNHFLGQFELNEIEPAPKGVPEIEVTFEIDANGILQVSAEDKGTGNKEKVTIIHDQNRLSPDEIKGMIKDAEKFADVDKIVEANNEMEAYAYLNEQIAENTVGVRRSDAKPSAINDKDEL